MRTCMYPQVLSESVGKALLLTGLDEVTETARFVQMMDKFFDCLNVHNYTHGYQKRKPFQLPYRSGSDSRLQVVLRNYSNMLYLCDIYFCFVVVGKGLSRIFGRVGEVRGGTADVHEG